MNYMGIDHHKQYSHITLLDEKGEKLKSGRVANRDRRLLFGTCDRFHIFLLRLTGSSGVGTRYFTILTLLLIKSHCLFLHVGR